MPRPHSGGASLLPLADRVARIGGLTAVLVGLALCAIVQQSVTSPSGRPRPAAAGQSPKKMKHRPAATKTRRGTRPGPAAPLERQVRNVLLQQRTRLARSVFGPGSLPSPRVSTTRLDRARGWAFGTAAMPPPPGTGRENPAVPLASLFLAHRTAHAWSVFLTGAKDFAPALRKAPVTVVPRDERPFLARFSDALVPGRGSQTGLALPWDTGQSWTLQPLMGNRGLRFGGGNGRVLAPGAGRLYRLCTKTPGRGMLMLLHPNGMASEYYRMTDIPRLRDGSAVKQGTYLGRTGTDEPCGGPPAAGPATVDFALCGANHSLPLDGAQIGGWTLHAAGNRVWAVRSGLRIDAGNPLLNFGTGVSTPSPAPHATAPPPLSAS